MMSTLKLVLLLGALFGVVRQCAAEGAPMWVPARLVNVDYPLLGLQSRTQGLVRIECVITVDGSVSSAKIISGSPLLGASVLTRIAEWRFRWAGGDSALPSQGTITMLFRFVLEGHAAVRPETKFIFEYPNTATVISQAVRRSH